MYKSKLVGNKNTNAEAAATFNFVFTSANLSKLSDLSFSASISTMELWRKNANIFGWILDKLLRTTELR